jgi:hypothetical protein
MTRILLLTLMLLPLCVSADSIYRTTDEEGNVVFTDAPSADGGTAEAVGVQRTNTTAPPSRSAYPDSSNAGDSESEAPRYNVVIVKPANETSFPMGPGNFSVSARVYPSLEKYESLQLFMDGEPWGSQQPSAFWDLTNVFRGAHDITVGAINADGETLATSEPVRVYVHRPSTNFKNRK